MLVSHSRAASWGSGQNQRSSEREEECVGSTEKFHHLNQKSKLGFLLSIQLPPMIMPHWFVLGVTNKNLLSFRGLPKHLLLLACYFRITVIYSLQSDSQQQKKTCRVKWLVPKRLCIKYFTIKDEIILSYGKAGCLLLFCQIYTVL
jgi:hypothetical protein